MPHPAVPGELGLETLDLLAQDERAARQDASESVTQPRRELGVLPRESREGDRLKPRFRLA
jgi:hypothetical protein